MADAPLRKLDPTRTITLRRVFAGEINTQLEILRKELFQYLFTNDSLSLYYHSLSTFNTANDGEKKVQTFREWLSNALASFLGRTTLGKSLKKAYEKGMERAYSLLNKGKNAIRDSSFLRGTVEEFKRNAGSSSQLNLLIEKARNELKGLGEGLTTELLREFSDSLSANDSQKDVEKKFNTVFKKYKDKAILLSGNAVVQGHAWGELDGLKGLGVTHVGVEVEFRTAGDSRVCPLCAALEGQIYPIEEAYGIIPVHIRCRCMFIPAVA